MTRLTVYGGGNGYDAAIELDTHDSGKIAETLKPIGVTFTRWTPKASLTADASDADVLAAYGDEIKALAEIRANFGYPARSRCCRVLPAHANSRSRLLQSPRI